MNPPWLSSLSSLSSLPLVACWQNSNYKTIYLQFDKIKLVSTSSACRFLSPWSVAYYPASAWDNWIHHYRLLFYSSVFESDKCHHYWRPTVGCWLLNATKDILGLFFFSFFYSKAKTFYTGLSVGTMTGNISFIWKYIFVVNGARCRMYKL